MQVRRKTNSDGEVVVQVVIIVERQNFIVFENREFTFGDGKLVPSLCCLSQFLSFVFLLIRSELKWVHFLSYFSCIKNLKLSAWPSQNNFVWIWHCDRWISGTTDGRWVWETNEERENWVEKLQVNWANPIKEAWTGQWINCVMRLKVQYKILKHVSIIIEWLKQSFVSVLFVDSKFYFRISRTPGTVDKIKQNWIANKFRVNKKNQRWKNSS